jgi:sugar lactone lactonase YvrE
MFWTDWGTEPKIERAGMDGSHRQTIVSYEVKWPNGLTLDLVKKRVYWVDAKLNVISSCNYDGSERRVILYSPDALQHPFSITTFEDWVYWTDWDKQAVYRANKFNGRDITPITATHMVSELLWSPFCSNCSVTNIDDFYLQVLHPVAYLSNWFFMTLSIATKFQYINSL